MNNRAGESFGQPDALRRVDDLQVVSFRGVRQLVGNLIAVGAGLVLFVVLMISVAISPPSSGSSAEAGELLSAAVGIGVMLCLVIRLRVAFTVELGDEALIYRTLLRTRRFPRSEITNIARRQTPRTGEDHAALLGDEEWAHGLVGRHGNGYSHCT
jgi:hypothetical protein